VVVEMVPVVLGGVMLGFLAGLFAFKVKSRWCPRCGASTEAIRRAVRR
jgi:membrane-associated phospholipid phosphatase